MSDQGFETARKRLETWRSIFLAPSIYGTAPHPNPNDIRLLLSEVERLEVEVSRLKIAESHIEQIAAENESKREWRIRAEKAEAELAAAKLAAQTSGADLAKIGMLCGIRDDEYPLMAVERVIAELATANRALAVLQEAVKSDNTENPRLGVISTVALLQMDLAAERERTEDFLSKHDEKCPAYQMQLRLANELAAERERTEKLEKALREIEKGEGPYSRDPLVHAANTVEHMQALATEALRPAAPDPTPSDCVNPDHLKLGTA